MLMIDALIAAYVKKIVLLKLLKYLMVNLYGLKRDVQCVLDVFIDVQSLQLTMIIKHKRMVNIIGNVDDCGFQKVLTEGFFYVIDGKEWQFIYTKTSKDYDWIIVSKLIVEFIKLYGA